LTGPEPAQEIHHSVAGVDGTEAAKGTVETTDRSDRFGASGPDYTPKYAFFTWGSSRSWPEGPLRVMRPVSRT